MTTSCLIFHGPGAQQKALDEAGRQGRLMHDPFGEGGLKVDEARELVSLLQSAPVGAGKGIVLAGPMDQAPPKSSDVLLKAIEEYNPHVRPMLWANDLGGVRNTIRSRCLDVWCPATGLEPVDEEMEDLARQLLDAAINDRVYEVPGVISQISKRSSGWETDLLQEVAEAMTAMIDHPKVLPMWERVRSVARWRNPTKIEVMAAFLPGDQR